ncbi:type I glutamate--ammonia ligase [Myxococcota bacterium]|nr:type I glutamate--ammonia ligase [Myxococcota bacterium]MBU1536810.1 type I glutamate--ammonia ligase [Myxococcota bacterium]
MFQSLKEARAFAEKEKINWIDIKFSDLEGDWRHVTLSTDEHTWYLFEHNGIGFDASSVKLQSLEHADMVLKPIWETGFVDPFFPVKTLSFISAAIDVATGAPSSLDPRQTLGRAVAFGREQGIFDEAYFAPEYEFYLFDSITYQFDKYRSGYTIVPQSSSNGSEGLDLEPHEGYHRLPPYDKQYEFRMRAAQMLVDLGVPIHYHHHEVGGAGQGEFEVKLTPALQAADHVMLVKYVCKQLAAQMNLSITFMPKPLGKHPGSGMHCHQNFYKGGINQFYQKDGFAGLSATAEHYLAGILDNGQALLGITNPSVNSYQRLVPGYEAPTKLFYSPGNRSASIRIPKYCNDPLEQRIEFRSPDATANPYFLIAGQLMAGLDGVIERKDPRALGFGPVEGNIFQWDKQKLKELKSLPANLGEALAALTENHAFLTRGDVFAEEFFSKWCALKEAEIDKLKGIPHPLELKMYYMV